MDNARHSSSPVHKASPTPKFKKSVWNDNETDGCERVPTWGPGCSPILTFPELCECLCSEAAPLALHELTLTDLFLRSSSLQMALNEYSIQITTQKKASSNQLIHIKCVKIRLYHLFFHLELVSKVFTLHKWHNMAKQACFTWPKMPASHFAVAWGNQGGKCLIKCT